MLKEKLKEVHEDARYTITTHFFEGEIERPFCNLQRVMWFAERRKESALQEPEKMVAESILDGLNPEFKEDYRTSYGKVINEMFSKEEVEFLFKIFSKVRNIVEIEVIKYSLPFAKKPRVSPVLGSFISDVLPGEMVMLSHVIQEEELRNYFQDSTILIRGVTIID
jgi:hypothetical protein